MKKKKEVTKKKPVVRKSKVEKPFNAGSMSNSAFFGWLRSRLRKMSMQGWKPTAVVKNASKIPYIGDNKRRKFSYICGKCGLPYSDKEVAVHHIEPAGSLKAFSDVGSFCERLFVESDKLILLCDGCHTKEHKKLDKLKLTKNDTTKN